MNLDEYTTDQLLMDIFQLIANHPNDDYMHVVICEDGFVFPMTFAELNESDMEWAKQQISEFG